MNDEVTIELDGGTVITAIVIMHSVEQLDLRVGVRRASGAPRFGVVLWR